MLVSHATQCSERRGHHCRAELLAEREELQALRMRDRASSSGSLEAECAAKEVHAIAYRAAGLP
jgi:hypothetical protein